jgi:hypothetical protein
MRMTRVNVDGCARVPNGGIRPDDEIDLTGLRDEGETTQGGNGYYR